MRVFETVVKCGEDVMQQTPQIPCPECGKGPRVLCDFGLTPTVLFRRLVASGSISSTAKSFVCLNCGYAMIFVSDPDNLKLPTDTP
jgi:predicted RNA-binding Zn-ribbon protein involved in translation (DUF1610 family)